VYSGRRLLPRRNSRAPSGLCCVTTRNRYGRRPVDPRCVVIEAVLLRSHDDQTERVHVGEITRIASVILKVRGEAVQLEAKEVGAILRQLGLSPMRDRKGFAVRLNESIRHHIHQLASRFAVATVQEGTVLCAHCAEFVPFEPRNEGRVASME
jgi:hypothetical protein